MGIGYTANVTVDSDMLISTNAGGTYGGYLGLDANGITDAKADIVLEPKTNVFIATGSVGVGQQLPTTNINTNSSFFRPDTSGKFVTINGGANGGFIMLESTTTTDSDQIGGLFWTRTAGQGDAHKQVAGIDAIQQVNSGASNLDGATLRFFTKPNNSGTNTPRLQIDSAGNIKVGTTTVIDSSRNLTNIGTISSGALTVTSDTYSRIYSSTNGASTGLRFSDQTSRAQFGDIQYFHSDTLSYGSGNTFVLTSSESTLTILADGKLMFKDGLFVKPSSGTGAGTQIIDSSRNLTNIGTISSGIITSTGIIAQGDDDAQTTTWGTAPTAIVGGFSSGNHDGSNELSNFRMAVISKDTNGGNSPVMQRNQAWVTGGVSGQAYNSAARWDLGRWENSGTHARSRLDLYLADNTQTWDHVMTWRAQGSDVTHVGIGTTSPDTIMEIVGADPVLTVRDSSTSSSNANSTLRLAESGASDALGVHYDIALDNLALKFGYSNDGSAATERMRIDSSGNLLVGQTTANSNTIGTSIRADGRNFLCVDDNYTAHFNRKSSDGNIVLFAKDDTTVGTIGVQAGNNVTFGGSQARHAGLNFAEDGSRGVISPMEAGSLIDDSVNLGSSTYRFNDLHLSGTIYSGNITSSGTGNFSNLVNALAYQVSGTQVISSARNIENVGTYSGTGNMTIAKSTTPIVVFETSATAGQDATLKIRGARTSSNTSDIASIFFDNKTSSPYTLAKIIARDPSANHGSGNGQLKLQTSSGGTLSDNIICIQSNIKFATGGQNRAEITSAGVFNCANDVAAFGTLSDITLKENIKVIENPIDKVKQIRGVNFSYKKDGRKSTGLIAQELEKVLPNAIFNTHELDDNKEIKAIRYGNVVGLLVEAIKEQQEQIDELKAKLDDCA